MTPVRNQFLCDRMGEVPLEEWARRSGVETDLFARILYLCTSPFLGGPAIQTYTSEALRIAAALGANPEEIFPPAFYAAGLAGEDDIDTTGLGNVPVSASILHSDRLQDPQKAAELSQLRWVLSWALGTLPERQHQVIAYLYGLEGQSAHSVRECAEKFGITSTTVKYIEFEVRRKFRHPSRSRWIRRVAYLPQEDPEPLARLAG